MSKAQEQIKNLTVAGVKAVMEETGASTSGPTSTGFTRTGTWDEDVERQKNATAASIGDVGLRCWQTFAVYWEQHIHQVNNTYQEMSENPQQWNPPAPPPQTMETPKPAIPSSTPRPSSYPMQTPFRNDL